MSNASRLTGNDASWIVVMNSTKARILARAKRHSPLRGVAEYAHPEGRMHPRDLTSDLGGRTFDSHGQGRHSMDADFDPRAGELEEFVRQVTAEVERGRLKDVFQQLILIAPPKLLGALRSNLSAEARRCVTLELSKQLVDESPGSIEAAIDAEAR